MDFASVNGRRGMKLRIINWCNCILLITTGVASICLLAAPPSTTATDTPQDELTNTIVKIAKEEYHKHTYKWTDYEKQFTRNMSADQFAALCIGIARFEHRRGRKWEIDQQAKVPNYNPAGRLISQDFGVMQINSKTGKTYFYSLDYENDIADNIRAGVKHLAAGLNEAYFKGLGGRDAINHGLQFYNPHERKRVDEIWHFIPEYSPPPANNNSSKAPAGARITNPQTFRPEPLDDRRFPMK